MNTPTSLESYVINKESGMTKEFELSVLEIFEKATSVGLTTNEAIAQYHNTHRSDIDETAEDKVMTSSLNNNLKARRTDLTHKGLIRLEGQRVCSITGRRVNFYVFVGTEFSEQNKILNELARIDVDMRHLESRRARLLIELESFNDNVMET